MSTLGSKYHNVKNISYQRLKEVNNKWYSQEVFSTLEQHWEFHTSQGPEDQKKTHIVKA